MAKSSNTKTNEETQLIIFNLGKEEFGVEINHVQEIIRIPSITKIPQAPDYVKGIINLRGRIITVLNLNTIMGIENKEQDENTRIIVANVNETVMGFMVDCVSEVLHLQAKNIEPAPAVIASKISTEYLDGVGKMDNRLLILLNLEKVFSSSIFKGINSASAVAEVASV